MENTQKLLDLYNQTSKHSNYQILFPALYRWLPQDRVNTHSRYEKERLNYILSKTDPRDKTFCDIGCNTGYFSFSLLDKGAKHGLLYEGNKAHAEFVTLAGEQLGWTEKLTVRDTYYDFQSGSSEHVDLLLLLNVLHHVGDDYDRAADVAQARQKILTTLNGLASMTKVMVFQLGFNWMGNRNKPLFTCGTKQEMIRYIEEGIKDYWSITAIGVAERQLDGTVAYNDLNAGNCKRNDELGEFLNRPIFILQRK